MNDGAERGWGAKIRDVGDAFLGVIRAEVAALFDDLGRSGRALVGALVWVAVAAAIAFWSVGLLVYVAVELLALVLPRWGAAAIVLGVFVLVAVVLVLLAKKRLTSIEPPNATLRRRMEENRRWWNERVAPEEPDEPDEVGEPDELDAMTELDGLGAPSVPLGSASPTRRTSPNEESER